MVETNDGGSTVGERLRAAREAQQLDLEDVAARTRISTRHLVNIESGDWDSLPAATYTIGFAKSYASAVGLDRAEIGDLVRAEIGGRRAAASAPEVFQPADPKRVPPKWLVLGAIAAVLLLVAALNWMRGRDLDEPDGATAAQDGVAATPASAVPPPPAAPLAPPSGPVVITANEPAWIKVTERGGATLYQGELRAGQSYEVPASATAPLLTTGRPEALRIAVGTADAPPVGPPGQTATNVSLRAADLMRAPAGAAAPQ